MPCCLPNLHHLLCPRGHQGGVMWWCAGVLVNFVVLWWCDVVACVVCDVWCGEQWCAEGSPPSL